MKTILCFGDSNTWGWNPVNCTRYPASERWTGILRKKLGPDYEVIEEGLNGRTTVIDDYIEEYRSGKTCLLPCLETHSPVDLVILMLGTNDMKKRFHYSAREIALGAGVLVNIIKKCNFGPDGKAPEVLLICPPPVKEIGDFAEMMEGAEEKYKKIPFLYKNIAKLNNCYYLDISNKISPSKIDGLHLEKSQHEKLALLIYDYLTKIFNNVI